MGKSRNILEILIFNCSLNRSLTLEIFNHAIVIVNFLKSLLAKEVVLESPLQKQKHQHQPQMRGSAR